MPFVFVLPRQTDKPANLRLQPANANQLHQPNHQVTPNLNRQSTADKKSQINQSYLTPGKLSTTATKRLAPLCTNPHPNPTPIRPNQPTIIVSLFVPSLRASTIISNKAVSSAEHYSSPLTKSQCTDHLSLNHPPCNRPLNHQPC